MLGYGIPNIYSLYDLREFQKFQKENSGRKLDEIDTIKAFGQAIHWLGIFDLLWLDFSKTEYFYLETSNFVCNDPDDPMYPIELYHQIAFILTRVWTSRLKKLYPDGDWDLYIEDADSYVAIVVDFRKRIKAATAEETVLSDEKRPNVYSIYDLPEFHKYQSCNPGKKLDGESAVVSYGRAIHWLSMFAVLFPDFENKDNYSIGVADIVCNDPDVSILPVEFYQQIAQTIRWLWLLQLEDLYPDEDWEVKVGDDPDITVSAVIRKRHRTEVNKIENLNNHKIDGNEIDIFQIIRFGDIESYKQQINKFDINIRMENNRISLLQEAIAFKQRDIAFDLLSRSIYVNNQDGDGMTALHSTCYYPDLILAEEIIKKGGRLDIIDKYSNTPLHYAVTDGNYELIQLFVNHGADPTIKNMWNLSPIDVAKQRKDEKLIKILQKEISIPIEHP